MTYNVFGGTLNLAQSINWRNDHLEGEERMELLEYFRALTPTHERIARLS